MESQLDPQAPAPAASWTRADDKKFESLLVEFPEGCANRFESVASRLPGRSVDEVVKRYEDLVADVEAIEAGLFPRPKHGGGDRRNEGSHLQKAPTQRKNTSSKWTEDEHRRFLAGLQALGKGDWRGISRTYVLTKTSSQVASHAQKYFMRQSKEGQKSKRRNSIHDVSLSSSEDDNNLRNNPMQQLHEVQVQQESVIIPRSQFAGPEDPLMDDVDWTSYMQQSVGASPYSQLVGLELSDDGQQRADQPQAIQPQDADAAHNLHPQQLSVDSLIMTQQQQQQPSAAIQSEHQDGDGTVQSQQQDGDDATDHGDQPFPSFDHLDENVLKKHEDLLADVFSDS